MRLFLSRERSTPVILVAREAANVKDEFRNLKEIADITKSLTLHIARHTFATTVILTNGVPIETVSKLLGHTKLNTAQVYAKVVESKLSDDMALFRNKLKKIRA